MLGHKICSLAGSALLAGTLALAACGDSGGGSDKSGSAPAATYTVGGTITGLTGSGLKLTLVASTTAGPATQTVTVPPGATSFAFPTGYALAASAANDTGYLVSVTAQPTDSTNTQVQTCVPVNAYGYVHATANVTSIQVTCTANTSSPLQGVYQVTQGGSPQPSWFAFSADGTYILATIQNNSSCNENGNGVDYGSYNWNSATGALQIQSALVYSLAPCGLTDTSGAVASTTRTLVRNGAGASAVLQFTTGTGTNLTLVPVASTPNSIVGAFTFGPSLDQGINIFGNNGYYVNINPQTDAYSGETAGIEYGCYTVSGSTLTMDTTADCPGAVVTAGTAGFTGAINGGAAGTATVNVSNTDANTLSWYFTAYPQYPFTINRFVPTSDAGCCSPVTTGASIGGTVTGLTAGSTPLALQLLTVSADGSTHIQSIGVAPGASTFTFPNDIPVPANAATPTYFSVLVAGEPTGPGSTCVPTNAFGQIAAAGNVSSVTVSCTANSPSTLRGVYQMFSDAAGTQPLQKWLAFTPDGTYIFADIENNSSCNANGNGIDYGAYEWTAGSGALVFKSAAIYSLAPCGFTNGSGAIDNTVSFALTRSGTGASTVLTLTVTGGSLGTVYLHPVTATSGSVVGAFTTGGSLDQGALIFFPVASGQTLGTYLALNPQNDPSTSTGYIAGLEYGCYSAAGGQLTVDTTVADCPSAILNAGSGGLSGGIATSFAIPYTFSNGGANLTLDVAPYAFVDTALPPN